MRTFSIKFYISTGVPLVFFRTLIYINDVAENMLSISRLFAIDNSLQQSSYDKKVLCGLFKRSEFTLKVMQGAI